MGDHIVLAVGAHPDDIELMMGGTLTLLGRAGCNLHMMNIANGSCGSMTEPPEVIAARRTEESRASAEFLEATFHPPITKDIEIYYRRRILRRLAAVVRRVKPTIMLLQSPEDYMEDHMNACRLAVTAAFVRNMPNFKTKPAREPVATDVTLYHSLPWGLKGPLGETILPHYYVDIGSAIRVKRSALAYHASQKEWLDKTQGLDSYLDTMEAMSREVGEMSGQFRFAEGWRRRFHLGFCAPDADPLAELLPDYITTAKE